MTVVPKKEVSLPFANDLPTVNDIHLEMKKLWNIKGEAFDGILYQCAQVAERIMIGQSYPEREVRTVNIRLEKSIYNGRLSANYMRIKGYVCPSCQESLISHYKFCPTCGVKLNWLKPYDKPLAPLQYNFHRIAKTPSRMTSDKRGASNSKK